MPITPFHMGPGLLVKALGGRHVSLAVFGFSQIAMDIAPLVRLMRDDVVLHGFVHTYVGATRISWPAAVAGALAGAYSHVLLDGVMHADMEPLAPFSPASVLLGVVSAGTRHVAGVLSGVLGALLLGTQFVRRRSAD